MHGEEHCRVSFNFFSLDYLYFPISGIMWVWHKVFGSFMGNENPWAWVLSVVFLVFTLRAILFKPFLKQMESQLKMQAVQPEMKRLREKYKDDRQRLAEEMMKFNKEAGVNPLASCLPALVQAPVFIGLFHVLRMFQPVAAEGGGWAFRNEVYFFPSADVTSFGTAKIFGGAPLGGSMSMEASQLAFMGGVRADIIWVGVPLTILAGIATFLTSRRSVLRQRELNPEAAANPQSQMMNRLMLFVFPLFVVIGGPFFPLAILFYWLANNSWTFSQLWIVHRMQDKRKAAEVQVVEEAKEAARFTKPTPGAKPSKTNRPVIQPKPVAGEASTPAAGPVDMTKDAGSDDAAGSNGQSPKKPSGSGNGGNRPPNRSKKKRR